MAAMHANVLDAIAERLGWTIIRLYSDLSKAFDTIIRQLVLGSSDFSLEYLEKLAKELSLPKALHDKIIEMWHDGTSLLSEAGVDDAAASMVNDLHHGSWFCLSSQKDITDQTKVVVPKCGSRQGCKLGAILFEIFYEFSLGKIKKRMKDRGITVWVLLVDGRIPWENDTAIDLTKHVWVAPVEGSRTPPTNLPEGGVWVPLHDLEYVDDDLFFVLDPSPYRALDKAQELLDIVVEEFTDAALKPNLKKGKTEVVAKWRGVGSRVVVRQLTANGPAMLISKSGAHKCNFAKSYKHLGTIRMDNDNAILDAKARSRVAFSRYMQLAYHVFANVRINAKVRLRLADSLIMSILLYGTETWTRPSNESVGVLNTLRLRVLRRIVGAPRYGKPGTIKDREVLEQLHLPSTDILLRQRRLRNLTTLVRDNMPIGLKAVMSLASATEWGKLWAEDIKWLVNNPDAEMSDLSEFRSDPSPLYNMFVSHPLRLRKKIAGAREITNVLDRRAFARYEDEEGIAMLNTAPGAGLFVCEQCPAEKRRVCTTLRGLIAHKVKAHSRSLPCRRYVKNEFCPVCGRDFVTRAKVIKHVAFDSPICRDALKEKIANGIIAPLPDEVFKNVEEKSKEDGIALRKSGRHTFAADRAVPLKPAMKRRMG